MDIRTEINPWMHPRDRWSAIDADTYDCDCDQYGYYSLHPVGTGPTREAAIADLLEQIAERNLKDAERADAALMRRLQMKLPLEGAQTETAHGGERSRAPTVPSADQRSGDSYEFSLGEPR